MLIWIEESSSNSSSLIKLLNEKLIMFLISNFPKERPFFCAEITQNIVR